MNELQKYEIFLPAIPDPVDREYIQLFQAKKICEMSSWDIGPELNAVLTTAFYHCGYNIPRDREMIALQEYIIRMLKEKYRTITIEELKKCVILGADEEFGENKGISPATFSRWIKGYMNSLSRTKAKEIYAKLLTKKAGETAPPSAEQYRIRFIARLKELYESYQQKKPVRPLEAAFYFQRLKLEKIIVLSEDQWIRIKDQALKNLIKRAELKKYTSLAEYRAGEKFLQELNSNKDEATKTEMGYLGLMEWFFMLSETGQSIDEALQ